MNRRPNSQSNDFWCIAIAWIVLCFVTSTCRGEGIFGGQGIFGGWRPSSSRSPGQCKICGRQTHLHWPIAQTPQVTTSMPRGCYRGPSGRMICGPEGGRNQPGSYQVFPPPGASTPRRTSDGGLQYEIPIPPNWAPPKPPPRVQQQAISSTRAVQSSTVRVSFEGEWINGTMEAPEGSGSMVAVDNSRSPPRWLVVTAGHVQNSDFTPYIYVQGRKLPAVVLMPNSAYDLMALEFSGMPPASIVLPLATEYAQEGETLQYEGMVARIGRDGIITGYGGVVGSGSLVGYRKALMDIRGQVQSGMSGGPIYNRQGLQGVLAMNIESEGITRGSSTLRLWDLLPKAGIHVEGTRYRLAASEWAAPLVKTVPAKPEDRPPEIVIPVPTGPIEPNLEDYEIPTPGSTPDSPELVDVPPCAGIKELTKRIKALEERSVLSDDDTIAVAALILKAIKADAEFHATVAGMVEAKPLPDNIDAIADKVRQRISGEIHYEWTPETPTGEK